MNTLASNISFSGSAMQVLLAITTQIILQRDALLSQNIMDAAYSEDNHLPGAWCAIIQRIASSYVKFPTAAAGAALTSNSHLGSTLSNIAKTPTTMISSALGPSATAQRSNCCNSGNSEDFPVLTKNYSEALWLLQTPPPPCTTCRLTWYC